ncbi:MAG TPA: hypothetical protein VEO54_01165 [Thermoanaerobaculia bacterium]|nr:hypothetical protein [Thermoanaerobaculia bacterium]
MPSRPEDLEWCPLCDTWIDPEYLDEVLFHGFGSCIEPGAEPPQTGIRGVKVYEPPQG